MPFSDARFKSMVEVLTTEERDRLFMIVAREMDEHQLYLGIDEIVGEGLVARAELGLKYSVPEGGW